MEKIKRKRQTDRLPAVRERLRLGRLEPQERDKLLAESLQRLSEGETLADIAVSLGTTRQALTAWILRRHPDEYQEAQEAAVSMIAAGMAERLYEANDQIAIARARELNRVDMFWLERRFPKLYGQKQELTVTHRTDLAERIMAAEARLQAPAIDSEATIVDALKEPETT